MTALSPTKILVFGASGQTGKYVTKFALESSSGYVVVAFVRTPDKLRSLLRDLGVQQSAIDARLQIVQGDLTDADAIKNVIREKLSPETGDVIINCAGKPKACSLCGGAPLLPDAVRAIVQGMREKGLKRFLNQMGAMTVDKRLRRDPSYYPKKCIVRFCGPLMCIRGMVGDNEQVAPFLYKECADIEWIVSRPGLLVEGKSKCGEKYTMGVVWKEPFLTAYVDLGEWTVRAVFEDNLVHTSPTPGYVARSAQKPSS